MSSRENSQSAAATLAGANLVLQSPDADGSACARAAAALAHAVRPLENEWVREFMFADHVDAELAVLTQPTAARGAVIAHCAARSWGREGSGLLDGNEQSAFVLFPGKRVGSEMVGIALEKEVPMGGTGIQPAVDALCASRAGRGGVRPAGPLVESRDEGEDGFESDGAGTGGADGAVGLNRPGMENGIGTYYLSAETGELLVLTRLLPLERCSCVTGLSLLAGMTGISLSREAPLLVRPKTRVTHCRGGSNLNFQHSVPISACISIRADVDTDLFRRGRLASCTLYARTSVNDEPLTRQRTGKVARESRPQTEDPLSLIQSLDTTKTLGVCEQFARLPGNARGWRIFKDMGCALSFTPASRATNLNRLRRFATHRLTVGMQMSRLLMPPEGCEERSSAGVDRDRCQSQIGMVTNHSTVDDSRSRNIEQAKAAGAAEREALESAYAVSHKHESNDGLGRNVRPVVGESAGDHVQRRTSGISEGAGAVASEVVWEAEGEHEPTPEVEGVDEDEASEDGRGRRVAEDCGPETDDRSGGESAAAAAAEEAGMTELQKKRRRAGIVRERNRRAAARSNEKRRVRNLKLREDVAYFRARHSELSERQRELVREGEALRAEAVRRGLR